MKPRRVIVTLEIKTDLLLDILRKRRNWDSMLAGYDVKVIQVQANVIKKNMK